MNLYDSRILIVDDEKALSRMVEGVFVFIRQQIVKAQNCLQRKMNFK